MRIRWIAEDEVSPARALATGAQLRDLVAEDSSSSAVLYGAGLTGDALVLGRWQRLSDAVRVEEAEERALPILRRATGGPVVSAGEGIVYLALALRHGSVLIDCPPDRLLNRNVRGFLGGLSLGGEAAHYFGRHWLSLARRPAALVGWTREPDGRVLIELFAAHRRSFVPDPFLSAYPKRTHDPFGDKLPITLVEAWGTDREPEDIVRLMAEGHTARFGESVTVERSSLEDAERESIAEREPTATATAGDDDGLTWSRPRSVPIGFVSAGLRKDEEGNVADVKVAGDFFQDADAPRVLSEKLLGAQPEPDALVAAVNSTWDGSSRVIEGVKELGPILQCLLDVAGTG